MTFTGAHHGKAEEAMRFYGAGDSAGPQGMVKMAAFALNGGIRIFGGIAHLSTLSPDATPWR
ncbi:MAG TPA: hypothetical protein VFY92_11245 [Hyphomicrobiaceae bacterium]|nr:hypothetical protein [Hyphomicrobiaceae bacterium]